MGLLAKGDGVMKITISRGATINIGNYESARVEIGAEIDGDTKSLQELDEWVTTELHKAVKLIEKQAGLPPASSKRFTGK